MSKELIVLSVFCALTLGGVSQSSPQSDHIVCKNTKTNHPQMVQIPQFKNSWQIQRNCEFPKAQNVAFVVELFYKEWNLRFGDKNRRVLKAFNNLMIEWGRKKKPILGAAFDVGGQPIVGEARGLTLMPGYIWLWENKYERIAATALVHELVHSAIWASNGVHGDPDHEGSDFAGWTKEHTKLIREINNLLARLDI